ncbi:MAG: Fe-S cluster assembly protein SufD, partial [Alphaproteobacteria bacterium]|nr:Fe-S cluster assembly protein SufD [Alphaproteobacteria bacterium]
IEIAAGENARLGLRLVAAGEGQGNGEGQGGGEGYVGRLRLTLGAGASLVLLQTHEALTGGYLAQTDLEIVLGPGARLERLVLVADAADAVAVTLSHVHLAEGATFVETVLTTGARRQRLETRLTHAARHSAATLSGLYRLAGRRHADLTSLIRHEAPQARTDQLVRGVVDDQARGVFQGRILVQPGADGTDSRMGHHALILSDRAEVDAKPELEIYADDVSCAHGATVGALDAEALFYARQRGLSEAEARALLSDAFLGAVLDRIVDPELEAVGRAWLEAAVSPEVGPGAETLA